MKKYFMDNGRLSFNKLGNIFIDIGLLLSVLALLLVYFTRKNIAATTCPINENRNLIYLSIGISIIGLILSFINNRKNEI